jgi:Mitochondrial protein Pet127
MIAKRLLTRWYVFGDAGTRDALTSFSEQQTKHLVTRSQLDCQNGFLPRTTFDIKTRAVAAVRFDRLNHVVCVLYFSYLMDSLLT